MNIGIEALAASSLLLGGVAGDVNDAPEVVPQEIILIVDCPEAFKPPILKIIDGEIAYVSE